MVSFNSKNVFWKALIFTIIVFGIGVLLGFLLENSRADKVQFNLIQSEINLLDEQLRNKVVENLNVTCSISVPDTFDFADKIYEEALKLEKYDSSSKFTNVLKEVHKRYDLLRMVLWLESLKLKENCPNKFHTVVYFFNYDIQDTNIRAKQSTFSHLLIDLKEKHPNEILLIPIASNLDLESVNIVLDKYDIKETPVIIVDEKEIIRDIVPFDELEKIVLKGNNK